MIYIIILIFILYYFLKDDKNNNDYFDSIMINDYDDIDNKIENEINNSIVHDIISGEEQDLNCHLYGCNNSKTQTYSMYFIGRDDKQNMILSFKNNYYTITDNNLIQVDTPKEIIKNEEQIMIPVTDNKLNIKMNLDDYELVGYLKNNYYHYKYLLYYKKIMNSLYEYIVVELVNDNYNIKYIMPPKQRIYNNETVYIEENRTLRLGPFEFTNKF
jgi:hypothetical protein